MTTSVRLLGWKVSGLRCPDHSIECLGDGDTGNDAVSPITLIQMPNGTGKTTTLQLLRATLSGVAEGDAWDEGKVLSFSKEEHEEVTGTFSVNLLVNNTRVTLSMYFDFEQGTVRYGTTLPSGEKQGFHPPSELEPFVRSNFVEYFVFHGELANTLLDPSRSSAQSIVEDLFHLNLFKLFSARIEEYWESKVEDRGAKTQKGFTRRKNRVRRLEKRIRRLEREKQEKKSRLEDVKKELKNKKEKFSDAIEERNRVQERISDIEEELGEARSAVRRAAGTIVSRIKNPCTVASSVVKRLRRFKASLDQAKLPESAAKEFFVELSQQDECVCGRPLTEDTSPVVRERADQYLGSENVALLNTIKSRIADQYAEVPEDRQVEAMSAAVQALKDAQSEVNRLRTKRDAAERDAASDDPDLERALDRINELRATAQRLDSQLNKYQQPSASGHDTDVDSLPVLRKRLTETKKKLSEITSTLTLKRKIDVVNSILRSAHETALQSLSEEICNQTNERIEGLMPGNPVRVVDISRSLQLAGQESGSTGENLSVAYAFLSTLFNRASHTLPFVIDSPANPIDLEVRRSVGALVPELSDQVVAFTISSERAGFLGSLQENAANIRYMTLFRSDNPEVDWGSVPDNGTVRTDDGVLVNGQEFFEQFQVDEEA